MLLMVGSRRRRSGLRDGRRQPPLLSSFAKKRRRSARSTRLLCDAPLFCMRYPPLAGHKAGFVNRYTLYKRGLNGRRKYIFELSEARETRHARVCKEKEKLSMKGNRMASERASLVWVVPGCFSSPLSHPKRLSSQSGSVAARLAGLRRPA